MLTCCVHEVNCHICPKFFFKRACFLAEGIVVNMILRLVLFVNIQDEDSKKGLTFNIVFKIAECIVVNMILVLVLIALKSLRPLTKVKICRLVGQRR